MFNVYLLDDEPWQVKSLLQGVKWEEHDSKVIGTNTNSVKAFEEILTKKPDIVFTDVKMPVLDGLKLIENLIEEKFQGVFVVISGHAEYEYAQKAISFDVVDYCLKPFEEEQLTRALEKAKTTFNNRKVLDELKIKQEVIYENQVFNDIMTYINEHFSEDITLQSVSDIFYINSSYLSKLFKSEMGINFTSYLSNKRLKRACILLKESSMQVSEIAESVGFSNYFYFARVFKKAYGITPTEYKRDD